MDFAKNKCHINQPLLAYHECKDILSENWDINESIHVHHECKNILPSI